MVLWDPIVVPVLQTRPAVFEPWHRPQDTFHDWILFDTDIVLQILGQSVGARIHLAGHPDKAFGGGNGVAKGLAAVPTDNDGFGSVQVGDFCPGRQ